MRTKYVPISLLSAARSVLKDRGTSSADSSPQINRPVTQGVFKYSMTFCVNICTHSVPLSMDSHLSQKPPQVPEATKKLPGSSKTIKVSSKLPGSPKI